MGESFLCYHVLQQSFWMRNGNVRCSLQNGSTKVLTTSCKQQMQCLKQILKKNLLHKFPEVIVPCQYFVWLSVNNYFYILWKWCTKIFTIFVGMKWSSLSLSFHNSSRFHSPFWQSLLFNFVNVFFTVIWDLELTNLPHL